MFDGLSEFYFIFWTYHDIHNFFNVNFNDPNSKNIKMYKTLFRDKCEKRRIKDFLQTCRLSKLSISVSDIERGLVIFLNKNLSLKKRT